ncbi:MAG: hypothetical protein NWS20_01480 [Rickettsiaceae bacterium]|nr:hypothetical protein [Rickettsiaceae bacterium]MDP5021323.1 hypothetical protein [Rickettsiaceae bacterium]MDP5083335.1 hypothetical protein [Rickettsiaceae bacterium]
MAKEHKLVINSFAELKDFILNPMLFNAINVKGAPSEIISIEQCSALAEAIKLHSGRISFIKLNNVCMSDKGAITICEALASRSVLSNYQPSILDLGQNCLTDASISALKSLGLKVKALYLHSNYFGDGALQFKGSVLANEFNYVILNDNYIKTTEAITKFSCFSDYISCANQKLVEGDDSEVIGEGAEA